MKNVRTAEYRKKYTSVLKTVLKSIAMSTATAKKKSK